MALLNENTNPSYTIKASSLALGAAGAALAVTPGATKKVAVVGVSVDTDTAIDITISRYYGASASIGGGTGSAVTPAPHDRAQGAAGCSATKYTGVPTPANGTETELLARPIAANGAFVWTPKDKWQQPLIFNGVTDFLLIKGSAAASLDINLEIVEF